MSVTAFSGPVVAFGRVSGAATTAGSSNNADAGPSLFHSGVGILDNRDFMYSPGSRKAAVGWYGIGSITTMEYIPTALGPATIYASQVPTTGVPLVKPVANTPTTTIGASLGSVTGLLLIDALRVAVTGSIAGNLLNATAVTGTVMLGTVMYSATGAITPTMVVGYGTARGDIGTYMLDSSQTFPSGALIGAPGLTGVPKIPSNSISTGTMLYNPPTMVGRAISITTAAGDTAIYTARGYDIYGAPMSESITSLTAGGTFNGKKAFKWLASVTPVGTVGATVSVGTVDIFGFPLFSGTFQDVAINWNNAAIVSATGYLPGSGATPTATTGDVRGTYAVQTVSDGSKRLIVRQTPAPGFVTRSATLFGMTQA